MKKKILKILSVIFQTFGIGALGLYGYNYFTLKDKYETMPKEVSFNLNLYLLIGISCILLYVILLIIMKFIKRYDDTNVEQLSLELEEEKNIIDNSNSIIDNNFNNNYIYFDKLEEILLRIESKLDSKIVSKKEEENTIKVPFERQILCPNCNDTIDSNAFVCLHCGYLLKELPVQEKIIYKENNNVIPEYSVKLDEKENDIFKDETFNVKPQYEEYPQQKIIKELKEHKEIISDNYNPSSSYYDNAYESMSSNNEVIKEEINNVGYSKVLKILAGMFVILVLIFGVKYFMQTTKKNGVVNNDNVDIFYTIANELVADINDKYVNKKIELNKNTVYFILSDLGYTSNTYNTNKSYVAINKNTNKIYISLEGINEYDKYSISLIEKDELDVSDVNTNTAIVTPIDDMLLIGNDNSVTIYYRG